MSQYVLRKKKPLEYVVDGRPVLFVDTPEKIERVQRYLEAAERVGVDTEFGTRSGTVFDEGDDHPYMRAFMVSMQFTCRGRKLKGVHDAEYIFVPNWGEYTNTFRKFRKFLESDERKKSLHQYKADAHVFANHGIEMRGLKSDTMVKAALRSNIELKGLKPQVQMHLGIDAPTYREVFTIAKMKKNGEIGKQKFLPNLHDVVAGAYDDRYGGKGSGVKRLVEYAVKDPAYTLSMDDFYDKELSSVEWARGRSMLEYYEELNHPMVQLLFKMERRGCLMHQEFLEEIRDSMINKVIDLEQEFFHLCVKKGISPQQLEELNLGSPTQIGNLFASMGMDLPRTPTGKISTSDDSMNSVKSARFRPIIKVYQEWASIEKKLLGTYIRPWIDYTSREGSDNMLRCEYNFPGTVTDRLSCVRGDTLVHTDQGDVPISEMSVGMKVFTHQNRWKPVLSVFTKGVDMMYEVELATGDKIVCTKLHQFKTPDGWKRLYELQVGERVTAASSGRGRTLFEEDFHSCVSRSTSGRGGDTRAVRMGEALLLGVPQTLETALQGGVENKTFTSCGTFQVWQQAWCARGTLCLDPQEAFEATCGGGVESSPSGEALWHHGVPGATEPQTLGFTRLRQRQTSQVHWEPQHRFVEDAGLTASGYSSAGGVVSTGRRGVFLRTVSGVDSTERGHLVRSAYGEVECLPQGRSIQEDMLVAESVRAASGNGVGSSRDSVRTSVPRGCDEFVRRLLDRQKALCGSRWELSQYSRGETKRQAEREVVDSSVAAFPNHACGVGRACSDHRNTKVARITSIKKTRQEVVWDITVDEDESYTAQGFVNHNSRNPNLQNIPRTGEDQADPFGMRRAFVAPKGYAFGDADLSQIEMRLMGHFTRDPIMLEAIRNDWDLHARTAYICHPEIQEWSRGRKMDAALLKEIKKNFPDQRQGCKTVNFMIGYGGGPARYAEETGKSLLEGKRVIAEFFKAYKGLQAGMLQVQRYCRKTGYVKTLLGRRLYVEGINSYEKWERHRAERQAFNFVIQGSAAELLKMSMILIDRDEELESLDVTMRIQIHDELGFYVPHENAKRSKPIIDQYMSRPYHYFGMKDLLCETPGEVEFGDNWNSAKAA